MVNNGTSESRPGESHPLNNNAAPINQMSDIIETARHNWTFIFTMNFKIIKTTSLVSMLPRQYHQQILVKKQ
jgi:hypothetical protein